MNSVIAISKIEFTKIDWAVISMNLFIRDIFIILKIVNALCRVFNVTEIVISQQWHNYVVFEIFNFIDCYNNFFMLIADLILFEMKTQIKIKLINCWFSRHEINSNTDKIIWIVFFLRSVASFIFSNVNQLSRLIEKKHTL